MRIAFDVRRRAFGILTTLVVTACGLDLAGVSSPADDAGVPSSPSIDGGGGSDSNVIAEAAVDDTGNADVDSEAPPLPILYAASGTKIYTVNPNTAVITPIGDFTTCLGIEELAVDRDGKVVATRDNNQTFFDVNLDTKVCTPINKTNSEYPIALTFSPNATGGEDLLGYMNDGSFRRVDRGTGDVTLVGDAGVLGPYKPSADVIYGGGHGYLSAYNAPDCTPGDCLLAVDLATGTVLKSLGAFPEHGVTGLAYWGGKVFGFTADKIYVVIPDPFMNDYVITRPVSVSQFRTAGSTTRAPSH